MDKNCLLIEIQRTFTAFYPYLKIDFFKPNKSFTALANAKIDPLTSLKQLSNINGQLTIDINIQRSVSMVAEDFNNMLGVIVQVSRKSGNVWNTISVTDGWTLETQNTAGELISSIMSVPAIKA